MQATHRRGLAQRKCAVVKELFASARLLSQGPIAWYPYIPNPGARVYVLVRDGEVVYIGQDPYSRRQRLQESSGQQSVALWAYWASIDDPGWAEAEMLRWFSRNFNHLPSGNVGV